MPSDTTKEKANTAPTAMTCSVNSDQPPPKNTPSLPASLTPASAKRPSRIEPSAPPTRWTAMTSRASS